MTESSILFLRGRIRVGETPQWKSHFSGVTLKKQSVLFVELTNYWVGFCQVPPHKKWSFPLKIVLLNVNKYVENSGLFKFTKQIFYGKLHFLYRDLFFFESFMILEDREVFKTLLNIFRMKVCFCPFCWVFIEHGFEDRFLYACFFLC